MLLAWIILEYQSRSSIAIWRMAYDPRVRHSKDIRIILGCSLQPVDSWVDSLSPMCRIEQDGADSVRLGCRALSDGGWRMRWKNDEGARQAQLSRRRHRM